MNSKPHKIVSHFDPSNRWTFTSGDMVVMANLGSVIQGKKELRMFASFLSKLNLRSISFRICCQWSSRTNLARYKWSWQAGMDSNSVRSISYSWTYQERRSLHMGLELLRSIRTWWQGRQESSYKSSRPWWVTYYQNFMLSKSYCCPHRQRGDINLVRTIMMMLDLSRCQQN